uniref:MADS-box domain-containing protein n=1 Tax=Kalanchoe fedtschenkoi TaxID=63787 RepID=A0A7N0RDU4_KALFE
MGGTGKKKIEIKRIEDLNKRYITFSKRRPGLFKKAEELSELTGCGVAALAFSPTAKKLHKFGEMALIDRYLEDTGAGQGQVALGWESGNQNEVSVEAALRFLAGKNLGAIYDLGELVEMRSVLGRIRECLVQHLNSG